MRDREMLSWNYRESPHGGGEIFSFRDGDLPVGKEVVSALDSMARATRVDLVSFAGTPEDLKDLMLQFPRDRGRLCSLWLPQVTGNPRPRFER